MKMMTIPGMQLGERAITHHIEKNESGYTLSLVTPGYSKDRLKIRFEEDRLEIKADSDETAVVFARTAFTKRFVIPAHVNMDAIEASYEEGVLRVQIPFKASFKKEVSIS